MLNCHTYQTASRDDITPAVDYLTAVIAAKAGNEVMQKRYSVLSGCRIKSGMTKPQLFNRQVNVRFWGQIAKNTDALPLILSRRVRGGATFPVRVWFAQAILFGVSRA
jgi:hypothetical protein